MEEWEKRFDEYVKSKQHVINCVACDEGLQCCLEKQWIRNFIKSLLRRGKAFEAMYKELEDITGATEWEMVDLEEIKQKHLERG